MSDPTALPQDLADLIDDLAPAMLEGADPSPYPHEYEADHDGQDDLDELGGPGDAPRTPRQAVATGRGWIEAAVYVGVGYCLKTIRSIYGVMALYPDAETAWEEAEHRHLESDPTKIPWGVPVFWTNGRYGHIALSIGGGRCITTDYVRNGYLGIAQISELASWCGGRLVGWTEDVNGVRVWSPGPEPAPTPDPEPVPSKPKRLPLDTETKLTLLRVARSRARVAGQHRRADALTRWIGRIKDRAEQ